ncbi:MAG: orotidine-5'-phosphate decarboxylase [Vicinamibacterales bacterium]
MRPLEGKDRLIVALDVPSPAEAAAVVDNLPDVSFYKIGWELFMAGVMKGELKPLLDRLKSKRLFIDLKIPGDIDNTVGSVVRLCVEIGNVELLTVSESMAPKTIGAAAAARQGSQNPKLLMVPLLSSLDAADLRGMAGPEVSVEQHILRKATNAMRSGCDGVIASGDAIRLCRENLPEGTLIVSPGIRRAGSSTDDHKRLTTPGDAIRAGSDYLVVGRPIVKSENPAEGARRIIEEIDLALQEAGRLVRT